MKRSASEPGLTQTMKNWGRFLFHYNNKLERVSQWLSQSTTMRCDREVSADFRHRETTTILTKTNEDKNINYNFEYLLLCYRVFASY